MARLARLYAPATVQYVVQRPAEGRTLFVDSDDYALFVALLDAAVRAQGVALHAYVLLPSQVRLLATPNAPDAIARTMQAIGRRYVLHLNRRAGRRGALWDRRYRSTLLDADEFLIATMRHIERQPVATGHAGRPGDWPWSSHAHHVGGGQQPFVTDHPHYWALSDTPFERQAAYRGLVEAPLDASLATRIESSVHGGWVLGNAPFVQRLGDRINRRPGPLQRGRPRRSE